MLAADYPFLDVLWTMLVFFLWVIWSGPDHRLRGRLSPARHLGREEDPVDRLRSLLPFLGVFIYLITQDMARRRASEAQAAQSQFDDYVRTTAGSGGAAAEIEKAKQLLDTGAITQLEFDAIKAKALT